MLEFGLKSKRLISTEKMQLKRGYLIDLLGLAARSKKLKLKIIKAINMLMLLNMLSLAYKNY